MAANNYDRKKKNQLVILIILIIFLAVVVFFQYLLMPLVDECGTIGEEIEANEMRRLDVITKVASIAPNTASNEEILKTLSEKTDMMYPVMKPDDVDILILGHIEKSGMSAKQLVISPPVVLPSSGVSYVSAAYSVNGSYAQFLNLLSYIRKEPSVVIYRVSGLSEEEMIGEEVITNNNIEDSMSFEITFDVFMYEAPVIPEVFYDEEEGDEESGYDESEGSLGYVDDYL